jgi:two-component system cell cycle response regulator
MTARILVVDDHAPNVKLLESRLAAEYYTVLTAHDGPSALAQCATGECDVVLLDVMMPGMDGFEVCRRIKADPRTSHLPVVMVTALDESADRMRALDAGADDLLTKPVDEMELIARVRSLARLKVMTDELRARASISETIAKSDPMFEATMADGDDGRILIVDDRPAVVDRLVRRLRALHSLEILNEPQDALIRAAEGGFDLIIIGLGFANFDALRLVGQLRALERTRTLPILLTAEGEDKARILRGLDLGVNDYLTRSLDGSELIARVRTQIRRHRYAERLRDNVQNAIELAGVDALTGLHNRRYFETHFADLLTRTAEKGRPLSVLTLDIDHFKSVNDTWGHEAGDAILKGFAGRIKRVLRTMDLVCRLGGEEFVVVMPDTPAEIAIKVAERLRTSIEVDPFVIDAAGRTIAVTVSVGLAERGRGRDAGALLKAADDALYASKRGGRNRVTAAAA